MALIFEKTFTEMHMQNTTRGNEVMLPCLPLYPPVELIHSFGFRPVVMWNMNSALISARVSESHLQNYVCSVASNMLDMLVDSDFPQFKAFFVYNACDTLRNLPEIVQAASAASSRRMPEMLSLHIPVNGFHSEGSREYFANQTKALINRLEALSGHHFSTEKFCASVDAYRKVREAVQAAEVLVAEGMLEYEIFSHAIAQCGMMPPEKQLEFIGTIIQKSDDKKCKSIPIVISGILPPPPEIIALLDSAGLRVAVNDIAAEGRSFNTPTPDCDEPIQYYMSFYDDHHPCTTLLFTAKRRINELVAKAERTCARGLIFLGEKFCEYEYFEIVHIEETFKKRGIPTLKLEFSRDEGGNYGSMKTRIDAFAELINP